MRSSISLCVTVLSILSGTVAPTQANGQAEVQRSVNVLPQLEVNRSVNRSELSIDERPGVSPNSRKLAYTQRAGLISSWPTPEAAPVQRHPIGALGLQSKTYAWQKPSAAANRSFAFSATPYRDAHSFVLPSHSQARSRGHDKAGLGATSSSQRAPGNSQRVLPGNRDGQRKMNYGRDKDFR